MQVNDFTESISISAPPFSKVIDADIIDGIFYALTEIDTDHEYDLPQKSFLFFIRKHADIEFMPPIGYEYLKTCFVDNLILSSSSNGYGPTSNISLNVINDKKIYRIFISEIKTLAESRDCKIDNLLEQST